MSLTIACLLGGAAVPRFRCSRVILAGLAVTIWACSLHTLTLCSVLYVDCVRVDRAIDAQLAGTGPNLVFVRDTYDPGEAFARLHNHPDLSGQVYAIWLDPEENLAVCRMFPQSKAWTLDRQGGNFTLEPFPNYLSLKSPSNYYAAGAHYLSLKQPRKALDCLLQALPGRDDARTLALIGQLEHDLGEPDAALESFAKALTLAPEVWSVRIRYADLLKQSNRRQEAREQYQAVIQGAGRAGPEGQEAARALLTF